MDTARVQIYMRLADYPRWLAALEDPKEGLFSQDQKPDRIVDTDKKNPGVIYLEWDATALLDITDYMMNGVPMIFSHDESSEGETDAKEQITDGDGYYEIDSISGGTLILRLDLDTLGRSVRLSDTQWGYVLTRREAIRMIYGSNATRAPLFVSDRRVSLEIARHVDEDRYTELSDRNGEDPIAYVRREADAEVLMKLWNAWCEGSIKI